MDEDDGFPMIFLHGLSDSGDFWETLINEFSKEYRIITHDLRDMVVQVKLEKFPLTFR